MKAKKQPHPAKRLATMVVVLALSAGHWVCPASAASNASSIFANGPANVGAQLPRDVPRHAAEALALAQKWRPDALLIGVSTKQSFDYALDFDFRSPSSKSYLFVTFANGRMTSQEFPDGNYNDGDPIPLQFIDLPVAVAEAQKQGMPSVIKEAWLEVSHPAGQAPALAWAIQPETDHDPYLYTINAALGPAPAGNGITDRADATENDTRFILQNRGQHTIVRMYWIATVVQLLFGDNDWGKNNLSGTIPPGESVTFTISRKGKVSQCNVNIKLTFGDKTSKAVRELNTCKIGRLISEY